MLRLKGMSARNEPRCRLCRRAAPVSSFSWTPTRSVHRRLYRPMACIDLFLRSKTYLYRDKAFDTSVQTRYKSDFLLFLFEGCFSPLDAAPQRDVEVTVGPTVGIVVKYLDTYVYVWLRSVGWNIVGRWRTNKKMYRIFMLVGLATWRCKRSKDPEPTGGLVGKRLDR